MALDGRGRRKRCPREFLDRDCVEAVRLEEPQRRELHVAHRLKLLELPQTAGLLCACDSGFHMIVTITIVVAAQADGGRVARAERARAAGRSIR